MLEETLGLAMDMCFPGSSARLRTWQQHGFGGMPTALPGRPVMPRSALCIDCAWMLAERSRSDGAVLRFAWADSSPQGGYDWLVSAFDEVSRERLVDLIAAVDELAAETDIWRQTGSPSSIAPRTVEFSEFVPSCVRWRALPLVVAPSRKCDLASKVGLLLHSIGLESDGREGLRRSLLSYHCFCIDMIS